MKESLTSRLSRGTFSAFEALAIGIAVVYALVQTFLIIRTAI